MTGRRITVTEAYDLDKKKKEQQLEILRKKKEKEEEKECTFFPNGKRPKSSTSREVSNRLYSIPRKQKNTIFQTNPNEKETYDFKPELTQYNKKMFNYNPIEDDDDVNRKLNRMEKARETKSILDLHKKLGGTDFKIFDYENVEPLPKMRFDIEYKTNKDSFWNYQKRLNNYNDITGEDSKRRESRIPLLKVEVNIDDNDKIVTLEIYQGDDPIKITEHFCAKYGLSEEKKMKLQNLKK